MWRRFASWVDIALLLAALTSTACKSRFCPEGTEERGGVPPEFRARHCVKGKIKHGPRVEYFEDGSIRQTISFKDGKRHGLQVLNYDNGVEQTRAEWKDGKRNGIFVERHRDGRIMQKSIWADGRFVRYDFPEPTDPKEQELERALREDPLPEGCRPNSTYPAKLRNMVPDVAGQPGLEIQYGGAIVGSRRRSRAINKPQFESLTGRKVDFPEGTKFYLKRCAP